MPPSALVHRSLWRDFMETYRPAEAKFRMALLGLGGFPTLADRITEMLSCEQLLKTCIVTIESSDAYHYDSAVRVLARETRRTLWNVETHREALHRRSGGKVRLGMPVVMSPVRLEAVRTILSRNEATAQRVLAGGFRLPADIAVLLTQGSPELNANVFTAKI
jgi:hypothetical protein